MFVGGTSDAEGVTQKGCTKMKSLRALLFVLVVPAAAACGGNHEFEGVVVGRRFQRASHRRADEVRLLAPVAIEEKPAAPLAKPDEPLEIPSKFRRRDGPRQGG